MKMLSLIAIFITLDINLHAQKGVTQANSDNGTIFLILDDQTWKEVFDNEVTNLPKIANGKDGNHYEILPNGLWRYSTSDPNAELINSGAMTETHIKLLCGMAESGGQSRMNWGIPPIFEMIFRMEDKDFAEYTSEQAAYSDLLKFWEAEYSKVHCKANNAVYGSLDMIALYYKNMEWIEFLYHPEWGLGADINRITWLDRAAAEEKGTLLDFLWRISRGKFATHTALNNSSKQRYFARTNRNLRTNYGARRRCEIEESCTYKYTRMVDQVFDIRGASIETIEAYERLLKTDEQFKSEYHYYHNLYKLKKSRELESVEWISRVTYSYEPNNGSNDSNALFINTDYDISLSNEMREQQKEKRHTAICEILSSYGINRYSTNPVSRKPESEMICR